MDSLMGVLLRTLLGSTRVRELLEQAQAVALAVFHVAVHTGLVGFIAVWKICILKTIVLEASVTVNATGCGFDTHLRK